MTGQHVLQVPPDLVGKMFCHLGLHFMRGLGRIGMTVADAADEIGSGKSQLWAVLDEGNAVAAFLTSIIASGSDKHIVVYALGGDGLRRWAHALDAEMMRFAKAQGASRIRFAGREAWSRVLPACAVIDRHPSGHAIFERRVA